MRHEYATAVTRWQRYWFAPGGRHGAAVVRIAIASSVLWTLWRLQGDGLIADPDSAPAGLYHPVGLLMLLGRSAPSPGLVQAMTTIAWVATGLMLVGVWSRTSTVVSWCAAVSVACYQVSFTPTWSHHNNLPFLVQLAFFGSRSGDVWSVDAWWRQRRKLPPLDVPGGYQWSLRLVQIAVGLMFFSAAMAKWFFGHFTLAWALSDNLRHQLLARFDWIGIPRTAVADWIIDDVWRYRVAAALNLLAQVTPLTAAFFVHRPRLRALLGSMFLVEVLALGLVMALWNVHWLPLWAVFVDWDRLRGWWQARRSASSAAGAEAAGGPAVTLPPRARAASVFVGLFLLYDAVVAFGLNQRLRTYPFSAYPMFGYVRAKRPYDQHQSYDMLGSSIEMLTEQPVEASTRASVQAWLDRNYTFRTLYQVRSSSTLRTRLAAVVVALQRRYPELHVNGARVFLTDFRAPPYPAAAELQPHRLAILGEVRNGVLVTALGAVRKRGARIEVTPRWTGMEAPAAPVFEAILDYDFEAVKLDVAADGTAALPPGNASSVIALVTSDGARFVVGELGKRAW
jgi:hypothetical protein